MTRSTNMEHVDVLERLRGVLEHGKMGDKCLIAPDLVTAAIASLSAQQPAADAGNPTSPPSAPVDEVRAAIQRDIDDHGVAEIRQAELDALTAPSAPVGVEALLADLETIWHSVSDDKETNAAYERLKIALAQQPAAPSAPVGVDAAKHWHDLYRKECQLRQDDAARYGQQIVDLEALAQQPAADGGFTAADMMDARQEGRKEAQQPAAERLAEALRELVEVFSESGMYDEEVFAKARAALRDHDQEVGNG